jgi:hypothetical protein
MFAYKFESGSAHNREERERERSASLAPALFLTLFPHLSVTFFSLVLPFFHHGFSRACPLSSFKYEIAMFAYENLEVYKKAYVLNRQVNRFLKDNTAIPRYAKGQPLYLLKQLLKNGINPALSKMAV